MEPDGKLVVTVSKELAQAWDPSVDKYEFTKNTYTYPFTQLRAWVISEGCLVLKWNFDSEIPSNRWHIPLQHILCIEVHTNSEEYIAWKREAIGSDS